MILKFDLSYKEKTFVESYITRKFCLKWILEKEGVLEVNSVTLIVE